MSSPADPIPTEVLESTQRDGLLIEFPPRKPKKTFEGRLSNFVSDLYRSISERDREILALREVVKDLTIDMTMRHHLSDDWESSRKINRARSLLPKEDGDEPS